MTTLSDGSFTNLAVARRARPGRSLEQSAVLLARIGPRRAFELLTATAWGRALGYRPEELIGESLSGLMDSGAHASEVIGALLDQNDDQPVNVSFRCKDGRRKTFRFHRRFDAYGEAMFLVADEVAPGDTQD